MQYSCTLSDTVAARSLTVTRGLFLASVHWELSVALVQRQGSLYRACALVLAQAAGQQYCLRQYYLGQTIRS
jgi:hypothetical protein